MLEQINASLDVIIQQTQANLEMLSIILLIPWTIYIISLFQPRILLLGIIPRTIPGLTGILFAPLLHGNFNHIFFNSIPLVVLSNFILINGLTYFLMVTLLITVSSGFLLWCFGKPGLHIGASGLITGYWALLVGDIVQQGTVTAIILGILSAYYFAGIFFGIFPAKKGVSWEGHLFGLISGFAVSYLSHYQSVLSTNF
ncbi:rhomboid family intramembrane serine protease [Legionella yabuuchiae]|uniref:rhomboid family intramembrane serine protease n=1 Tax=Legionella yabuuchiae TaxID=376727 RepID=UPI001055450A|nr:rhomboid family intramembrane serine protease [Legionella yabuuchiae]